MTVDSGILCGSAGSECKMMRLKAGRDVAFTVL